MPVNLQVQLGMSRVRGLGEVEFRGGADVAWI